MGNRAVISFSTTDKSQAVYVHWNGGEASILGFLNACIDLKLKPTMANFHKVAQAFIGSSAYLETVGRSDRDNGDNGWYIINKKWEVVERRYNNPARAEWDLVKTKEITEHCKTHFGEVAA